MQKTVEFYAKWRIICFNERKGKVREKKQQPHTLCAERLKNETLRKRSSGRI